MSMPVGPSIVDKVAVTYTLTMGNPWNFLLGPFPMGSPWNKNVHRHFEPHGVRMGRAHELLAHRHFFAILDGQPKGHSTCSSAAHDAIKKNCPKCERP